MKAIKRKISLVLAGLMVAGAVGTTFNVKAEEVTVPKANFQETTGYIVNGNQQSIFVTADYEGQVQYNVWYNDADGVWTQTGYGEPVDANVPTEVQIDAKAKTGENFISVWVKRADVEEKDAVHTKEFEGKIVGYDSHSYKSFTALAEGYQLEEIDYTLDGTKLVVNGTQNMAEGSEFKVFLLDLKTNKWVNVREEWGTDAVEYDVEPGQYYLDVQVNDPNYVKDGESADKWDAWRLTRIDVQEKQGTEIAFGTAVKALMIGSDVTVTSESDAVASYRLFKDGAEISQADMDAVKVGEPVQNIFPGVNAGDVVTVKFYDANGAFVAESEVALGENGTIVVEEKEMKEVSVEATVEGLMIGCNVTVTTEDADVASYRLFKDGAEISQAAMPAVKIGEPVQNIFPGVNAGEELTVKLYDANDALIAETTATLK